MADSRQRAEAVSLIYARLGGHTGEVPEVWSFWFCVGMMGAGGMRPQDFAQLWPPHIAGRFISHLNGQN